MHHPPVPVGHPLPDGVLLTNPGALADLLNRHPRIIAVLAGHAHTAAAVGFTSRPVLLAPAVTWTLVMPPQPGKVADLDAPVGIAFHNVEDGRIAGAAYLIVLGVHCWRTHPAPPDKEAQQSPDSRDSPTAGALAAYRQAMLANVLNPKAASIFLTLIPQFLDSHRPLAPQILTLATAQGLLVCTWLVCWTVVLAGASRLLSSPRATGVWKRASGCVLIGLGLRSAIA